MSEQDEYILFRRHEAECSAKTNAEYIKKVAASQRFRLRYPNYYAYLASAEWRRKREQRILLDGGVCTQCGSMHNLQVHHLSYEHLGTDAEIDDLITLCADCHHKLHFRRVDE